MDYSWPIIFLVNLSAQTLVPGLFFKLAEEEVCKVLKQTDSVNVGVEKVATRFRNQCFASCGFRFMEFVCEEGKRVDEECSSLILPALSIGNVGQLAVDLLVSSTGAERVGYLDDPNLLPCVGNDAYGSLPCGEIALPLEVYESSSSATSLAQQRSPVAKGMMIKFAANIADFAASSGKKHVIVLSSLDFQRLQNLDMSRGPQVYYLSNAESDGRDDHCERLGFGRLRDYDSEGRCWKYLSSVFEENSKEELTSPSEDELEDIDYYPSLPFAALFSAFKARGLKVTCLLCYCSEGDNIPDAFLLAEAVSKLMGLSPDKFHGEEGGKWRIPYSWKSMYGAPPDMSMF